MRYFQHTLIIKRMGHDKNYEEEVQVLVNALHINQERQVHNPLLTIRRHSDSQGVALITMLLVVATLLTALIAISTIITMQARRTIAKRQAGLYVQYTAESGLSAGHYRDLEMQNLLARATLPQNINEQTLEAHARRFCGRGILVRPPSQLDQWSDEERRKGFTLCQARPIELQEDGRLSIFSDLIPTKAYRDLGITEKPNLYWYTLFSTGLAITSTPGQLAQRTLEATSQLAYSPKAVRVLLDGSYRFIFERHTNIATGRLLAQSNQVSAVRRLQLSPSHPEFYFEIGKPSFARYLYFWGGGFQTSQAATSSVATTPPIFHVGGEHRYTGQVHLNGGLRLHASINASRGPLFDGMFTMTQAAREWSSDVSQKEKIALEEMFPKGYAFEAEAIALPQNLHGQRMAVTGQRVVGNTPFVQHDACMAFGMQSACIDGIHYSQSRPDTTNANTIIPNQDSHWLGGIYVVGDLHDLLITTTVDGRQQMVLEHASGQRVSFQQTTTGRWEINDSASTPKELQGDFNGLIFVEGNILRPHSEAHHGGPNGLRGDGSDHADIASDSRITVISLGKIVITESLTYAINPQNDPNALNVLGVITLNDNIDTDGPVNQDLDIHGAIMTLSPTSHLTSVDHTHSNHVLYMNVLGSLAVGNSVQSSDHHVAGPEDRRKTGTIYRISLEADPRFTSGFAPPYYPQVASWQRLASEGIRDRSLWQFKR